jgi:5-carboxymethyl-2-hydroxymuconic-semialdehyde dehydrogenase
MTTLDSQITKAREYLARFKTDTLGHFINGEWTLGSGEDTFENQSPINNKLLGTVVKGSAEDVNQACLAAQNAFKTETHCFRNPTPTSR